MNFLERARRISASACTLAVLALAQGSCASRENASSQAVSAIDGGGKEEKGARDFTGASCNARNPEPVTVQEMQIAEPIPTPQGGTIQSGIYYLTARSVYTGPGGKTGPTGVTEAQTAYVEVRGGTASVQIARTGMPSRKDLTLTFLPDKKSFSMLQTCPPDCADCGGIEPYTATPTSLFLIGDGPVKNRTRMLTKKQ